MLEMERKIATDSIETDEEKALLKAVRQFEQPIFFFTKFYELIQNYRSFLLIRLRYNDQELIDDFLNQNQEAYRRSKDIHHKLDEATQEIVQHYAGQGQESGMWEDWLSEIFYDEGLDGHLRYLALVRLTFLCYNHRRYDILREKFDYLDQQFKQGRYYSKRLLLNYYNNRLMLHSHYREYEQALYYGYLSVRAHNHDYPLYVNNLTAVLLRLERNEEALKLVKEAAPLVKRTTNFHNRVSFVAFYMEALNKNKLFRNAESYGDIFLRAYAKEVLQYRWHLFFSVYLEALAHQGHYEKLIKVTHKYHLLEQDEDYRQKANYLPVIPFLVDFAKRKEDQLSREAYRAALANYQQQLAGDRKRQAAFERLVSTLD
jgi:hypothetical protein